MPDNILVLVFGALSVIGLVLGGAGFGMAVKYAKQPEGEIKMALWAFLGLAGLVVAGMSWAYFLIPIILHHLFGAR